MLRLNKITEMIIDKYKLIPIVVMLMAVIYLVVSLSEINWGIFGADIALFGMAVLFIPEIRKLIRRKDSRELLRHESPINWLKISTISFLYSILSSVAYGLVNVTNVGFEYNPPIIEYLLIFCVAFFLFGLLYTVRVIWFIIDPASKANITAGKVIEKTITIGVKIILISFISVLQIFNGIMLYLILDAIFVIHGMLTWFAIAYLPTLILSFIATIPNLHGILFRLKQETRIRDWIVIFCFYSPWIVLIISTFLLKVGIVHL
jgi:hypothetical protein